MRPIRLLFDENTSRALETAIRRTSPATEVFRIGKPPAPALQTEDPDILHWCEANGALLISRDRATMPVHVNEHLRCGHHTWGVFLFRKQAAVTRVLEDILDVLGASRAEDWKDQIEYIPLNPFRSADESRR